MRTSNFYNEDDVPIPWKILQVPPYKAQAINGWELIQAPMPPLIRGYFNGLQIPRGGNWVLKKDNRIWMSVTPMELESQAPHAHYAKGHVVIVGAGMGVLLYNVLKKKEVTKVTLIEKDLSVLHILQSIMDKWSGIEKLTIIRGDALKPFRDYFTDVDFLSVDIWPTLGSDEAIQDMHIIYHNIPAKLVGYWGQELDLLSWAAKLDLKLPLKPKDYKRYIDIIKLPLYGQELKQYLALCVQAGVNFALT